MPTNEEGEFELILGNRQLLSVFFIVVILLGVFFTMGYIVGRNSTPVVTADAAAAKSAPKPLVVESPAPRDNEPASSEPAASSSSAPAGTAQQRPAENPSAKSKAAPKAEPKAEPPKPDKSENETAKAAPAGGGVPSGTYLQLAATTKREADIMVDVLRQKKFTALDSEIAERPGLFRVLVGPLSEADVNKTKTDLQSAGFPGDKAIKRSF